MIYSITITLRICVMIVFVVFSSYAYGRSIYVSQSGDSQGGNSWETAYQTIQTAIDHSIADDEIFISNESYDEKVQVTQNVKIHGGCIIGSTGDALIIRQVGSSYTRLVDSVYPITTLKCSASCEIVGVRISPQSTCCMSINLADVVLEDSIVENGSTGIYVNEGSATIQNVLITNNSASGSCGGLHIENYSTVSMTNCTISNNSSYVGNGGGISCTHSTLNLDNCRVNNNSAFSLSPVEPWSIAGGVMLGKGTVAELRNCQISGNSANEFKQLYYDGTGDLSFVNLNYCTIVCNLPGDIHWYRNPFTFTNCIMWGSSGILTGEQGEADISYSCIQGGYPGFGNISDDPLFRDSANGDYRLQPLSPCIDTAGTSGPTDDLNGNPRPVDIAGIGREVTDTYDMGAYEFQLNELPTPTMTPTPSQVDPGHTELYQ